MKKSTLIVLFILIVATSISAQNFEDFPEIAPKYDIGTSCSKPGYVKVQAYVYAQENLRFQLLSKEMDENKKFIQFKQSPLQAVPEFHLKVHTLHSYQAMIIAYDESGGFHAVSGIQTIMPSRFMHNEMLINPVSGAIVQYKKARSSGLEMITTIDDSRFDLGIVDINADITYNNSGNGLENLDKSNFEVTESSRYQTILNVVPPCSGNLCGTKIVDIAFIHDDSGSMGEERASVKENILDFVQKLQNESFNYRIALVPYGGGGNTNSLSDPDGTILHEGNLHSNTNDFENDLSQMKLDGGTEQAFCAIAQAITQLRWRKSTTKIIILLTDEPNNNCWIEQSELLSSLKETNTTLYCLYNTSCTSSDSDFIPLANQTNGKTYNIYDDFTPILNDISTDISSKYIVQYKTDDHSSQSQRDVQLKVTTPSYGSTTNTMYYTPNPFLISRTSETIALSNLSQRQQRMLQIVIKMTQNNTTFNATLHYKNDNSSFQSKNMISIGDDLYSAEIPASYVLPDSIQYYISATNSITTKTLPTSDAQDNPFLIPILPNVAPFIDHQAVTIAREGESISIEGIVEDVTHKVASIVLYYKKQGESIYNEIHLTPNTTQYTFNFTIPAGKVTSSGVAYYIIALDNFGTSTEIGTADNPNLVEILPLIQPGCQDIGNVKICAEKFQTIDSNHLVASGNVSIGTTSNDRKLLSTGASLNMHKDRLVVDTVNANNLYVLDVKRTTGSLPELIPLYTGDFSIDCVIWPPKLTYNNGNSILKLVNNILFSFPTITGNRFIEIHEDSVVLKNVFTNTTEGLVASINIGDIILSQTGNTTSFVNVNGQSINTKQRIKGNTWEVENISFQVDIANNLFKSMGQFSIPRVIDSPKGGIPSNFEFIENPLSLEKIYGNLGFPRSWKQSLMISTNNKLGIIVTHPEQSYFQINDITSLKNKKMNGNCRMQLYDSDGIVEMIKKLHYISPIDGDANITVQTGRKVNLSGDLNFLGYYPLTDAEISMKKKLKLSGTLTIPNIAYKRLDGSLTKPTGKLIGKLSEIKMNVKKGDLSISGASNLTLTMPKGSQWICGGEDVKQSFDLDFQFSKRGVEKASIITTYKNNIFTKFDIKVDFADPEKPVVKIENLRLKKKGFIRRKGRAARSKIEQFTINEEMDQLIVKYVSEEKYPDFSLTLPDGNIYSSGMVPTTVDNDDYTYGIYFFANEGAHESYYAIQTPPQGEYTVTTINESSIGDNQWVLYGPNSPPEITVNTPSTRIDWDQTSDIQITFTGSDADDNNAVISLFYDDNNTGNNGIMIANGISADLSANTFSWVIDDSVESGTYYIYAKIEDEVNAPVFAYSTGTLNIVSPWAPQTPSNLTPDSTNGILSLSWDENPETDLSGYRVYLSDTPSDYTYQYNFNVGLVNNYEIEGLTNGKPYAVAISAINYSGLESVLSDPIEVTGTDTQGSPDLCLDKSNSTITSVSGTLDGTLTIQARISNTADHESFSARIECYYGQLSQSNMIESRLIGGIAANSYMDVMFEIDSDNIESIHDLQYFYINIVDVVLPELNESNNMDVIVNSLSFTHEIVLNAGLNLISMPNSPESTAISPFLQSISNKIDYVATFLNNSWQFYYPDKESSQSNLTDLVAGNGYYFAMKSSATLNVSGSIATSTRFLGNGWNLLGLTTRCEIPLAEALNSVDGNYSRVWALENGAWQMYDPANSILSNLKTLKPGLGYFILVTTPSNLALP